MLSGLTLNLDVGEYTTLFHTFLKRVWSPRHMLHRAILKVWHAGHLSIPLFFDARFSEINLVNA